MQAVSNLRVHVREPTYYFQQQKCLAPGCCFLPNELSSFPSSCFVRFRPLEIFWRPLARHLGAGVTCAGSKDGRKTGSSPVLHVNPLHKQTTQHTGCVRLSSCLPSLSLNVKPQSSESTMYSNTTYFPTSQLPTLTLVRGTSCSLVNEPHSASAQRSA